MELSCSSSGSRRALQFRNDPLRQNLAEFHAPLVEGIDLPDGALREHAVFVQRHQLAESCRRQASSKNVFDGRLPSNNRCGTSQSGVPSALTSPPSCRTPAPRSGRTRSRQHVVMPAQGIEGLCESDEVAGYQPGALVDQLIERVLAVGARLAPIDRARFVSRRGVPSSVTCLPLLSIVSCWR